MSARDVLGVLRARDDADDEAALGAVEGDEAEDEASGQAPWDGRRWTRGVSPRPPPATWPPPSGAEPRSDDEEDWEDADGYEEHGEAREARESESSSEGSRPPSDSESEDSDPAAFVDAIAAAEEQDLRLLQQLGELRAAHRRQLAQLASAQAKLSRAVSDHARAQRLLSEQRAAGPEEPEPEPAPDPAAEEEQAIAEAKRELEVALAAGDEEAIEAVEAKIQARWDGSDMLEQLLDDLALRSIAAEAMQQHWRQRAQRRLLATPAELRRWFRALQPSAVTAERLLTADSVAIAECDTGALLEVLVVDEEAGRVRTAAGWLSLSGADGEPLLREVERAEAEREIGRPVGWTPEHPWSRTSVAQPAAAVKSVGANKKLKAAISRDIRQQQQQQPPEVRPELLKLQKLFRSDGDYLRVLLWLRDKVAEFDKRARVTVFSEEQREELEKKGQTLKSGADDLKDAIDALDKEFKGPKGKLKGRPPTIMLASGLHSSTRGQRYDRCGQGLSVGSSGRQWRRRATRRSRTSWRRRARRWRTTQSPRSARRRKPLCRRLRSSSRKRSWRRG